MSHGNLIRVVDVLDDPRLNDYLHMTDVALRRVKEPAEGIYIAESQTVISRALAKGHRPRSFLVSEKWMDLVEDIIKEHPTVPVFIGSPEELEQVTGFLVHRGALAAMERPALPSVAEVVSRQARRVVILEDIVDHTNVGAIFRAAAGLGVDAVLVTPQCADPLYRRSVRVSMGTVFQVPWTRIDPWPAGLDFLRDYGFEVGAMALEDDAISLDTLENRKPEKLALIMGTEGQGLQAKTISAADYAVTIPMQNNVDSLNVASAAAVAFWATRK